MKNSLLDTNQDSKLALTKSKKLLNITNSLLSKETDDVLDKEFKYKPFIKSHECRTIKFKITSNGKYLITADWYTIKLWDIQIGKYLKTIKNNANGRVIELSMDLDGHKLVSGNSIGSWNDEENFLQLWDISTGKCINEFESKALLSSLLITTCGEKIIYGNKEGTITLWDELFEEYRYLKEHENSVVSLSITSDGEILASGSHGEIKIWDMLLEKCLMTLKEDDYWIESLVITRNGNIIIYGADDNSIKIWDRQKKCHLKNLKGHKNSIKTLFITPDDNTIISVSTDNTIKLWSINSGECLKTIENHIDYSYSIAITPDCRTIILSANNKIRFFDIKSEKYIFNIDHYAEISINDDGYFNGSNEAIRKNLRIRETPSLERELTSKEINHFRKKGNFLEIGKLSLENTNGYDDLLNKNNYEVIEKDKVVLQRRGAITIKKKDGTTKRVIKDVK